MDKNMFLAFFLSALVIIGYYFMFPPASKPPAATAVSAPANNTAGNAQTSDNTSNTASPHNGTVNSAVAAGTESTINQGSNAPTEIKTVSGATDYYTLTLSGQNGGLSSLKLNRYAHEIESKTPVHLYLWNLITGKKEEKPPVDRARRVDMADPATSKELTPLSFQLNANENLYFDITEPPASESGAKGQKEYVMQTVQNGISVEKRMVFHPDTYIINVGVKVKNTGSGVYKANPIFTLGTANDPIASEIKFGQKQGIIYFDNSLTKYTATDLNAGTVSASAYVWGGVMSHYFISAVKKPDETWTASLSAVPTPEIHAENGKVPAFNLVRKPLEIAPGSEWQVNFEVYMGPKYTTETDKFDVNMVDTLGMNLNFIAQPMLAALRWFHNYTGNWGVAIILLTVLVRIFIFPLAYKGMKGMQKMTRLAPKVQALKKKYGDKKDVFNKEVMELYRKNKINPLGGCLPILIQLPIFFALYSALLPAIELRYQPFIWWVYDLSEMDHTFILPFLCGITMVVQQKLTPVPATADPLQTKMMRILPVVMSVFFAFTSSGLVLYWTVSGILSVFQQLIFNRVNKKDSASDKD